MFGTPSGKYKSSSTKVNPEGSGDNWSPPAIRKDKKSLSQSDILHIEETKMVNQTMSPELKTDLRRISRQSSTSVSTTQSVRGMGQNLRGMGDMSVAKVEQKMKHIKLTMDENWIAFLGISGFTLAVIEAELIRDTMTTPDGGETWIAHPTDTTTGMKIAISITTAMMLWFLHHRYYKEFMLQKYADLVPRETPYMASSQFYAFACEMMLFVFHPIPFIDNVFIWEVSGLTSPELMVFSIDHLLVMVMPLRFYTLIPLLHRNMGLNSLKARMAAKLNNMSISVPFTIKAVLNQKPIKTLTYYLVFSTALLAYYLVIVERSICSPEDGLTIESKESCKLANYGNAVWNVLITMTTVGYGDMYPVTTPGRVVAVVACIAGLLFTSLLVSVIDNFSQLERPELNVIQLMNREEASAMGLNLAASRLQLFWITNRIKVRNDRHGPLKLIEFVERLRHYRFYNKLSHAIVGWRKFNRKMKYQRHYSFIEDHQMEQNRMELTAAATCRRMWKGMREGTTSLDRSTTPSFLPSTSNDCVVSFTNQPAKTTGNMVSKFDNASVIAEKKNPPEESKYSLQVMQDKIELMEQKQSAFESKMEAYMQQLLKNR